MQRSAEDLTGYTIGATDGDIGAVEDFYFDDEKWTLRYLVVDTGNWLPGRKVLLSPISIAAIAGDEKKVRVKLSQEQVKNSPDVDMHKPVSRQHEIALAQYYGYPYYWAGPEVWGPAGLPGGVPVEGMPEREAPAPEPAAEEDLHLHGMREVSGYYIEATDGEIGHVDDFILDDTTWQIRYLVVDTRNWLPGKKVLIAPGWIHRVNWRDSKVYVNLAREAIKNSPEYDGSLPIAREYESRLYQHYDQPRYWERTSGS
ncbi:MAG TPA: PRC-barrel domain-containing protein [Candidatus Acidoferrales bacterium]|nr:PRC-barrel domain-containing protein [Candidatus Acidoferrales bacterium]